LVATVCRHRWGNVNNIVAQSKSLFAIIFFPCSPAKMISSVKLKRLYPSYLDDAKYQEGGVPASPLTLIGEAGIPFSQRALFHAQTTIGQGEQAFDRGSTGSPSLFTIFGQEWNVECPEGT
jgi:hypothetical protein